MAQTKSQFGRLKHLAAAVMMATGGSLLMAQPADTNPDSTAPRAADRATASDSEAPLARWLQINSFSFSARYRSIFDADGVHTYDQAQQRTLLDGRVKLDSQDKVSIGFRLSSGHYFDWAYADFMGGGTTEANLKSIPRMAAVSDQNQAYAAGLQGATYASGGWAVLPRQLYLDMKPVDGIEAQYGGLGFNRGVNTEITSYDDDGYLEGERLIVRKPKYLYFDEVSVTYAYLGDVLSASFFDRYQRLTQANYHQFLLGKKLTPWLEVSTDYTYEVTHTIREAALIKTKRLKAVNSIRVEAYQRPFDANNVAGEAYASGSGYSLTANKSFKKFSIQGGYADIDYNYDVYAHDYKNSIWAFALNGDAYGTGKRPFVKTTVKVTPYLNLFGYYSHIIDYNYAHDGFIWNQTAMNAGLEINFKPLFNLGK